MQIEVSQVRRDTSNYADKVGKAKMIRRMEKRNAGRGRKQATEEQKEFVFRQRNPRV